MNDILITIMLFWATMVASTGGVAAVVFLVALTKEFLNEHYGLWE